MNWVLLHGFVGSSEDFADLRGLLGPGASVIAPDWPGHGARSGLRSRDDYTLQAHLRVLDGAIAATRGPVTVVGYSLGGRILQHWLGARPGALCPGSRVALVSTGPGIADAAERRERVVADAAVARLLRDEGLPRFLHYWHSQTMFRPLIALPAERRAPILRRRSACDAEGLALSLESVGSGSLPDTWDVLGSLSVPTLVAAGGLDSRYVELARMMAARMPEPTLRILPGAGHALHLEKPSLLAEFLLAKPAACR